MSTFNFKVFDDLRNYGFIRHEMYLRNINEESIDVMLNQAIVVRHLRERQLVQYKELLKKATDILSSLEKEYDLPHH